MDCKASSLLEGCTSFCIKKWNSRKKVSSFRESRVYLTATVASFLRGVHLVQSTSMFQPRGRRSPKSAARGSNAPVRGPPTSGWPGDRSVWHPSVERRHHLTGFSPLPVPSHHATPTKSGGSHRWGCASDRVEVFARHTL